MTLDEIRWMSRLFETRNMTKTAEALFISQPALSQALKRVEEELGFPLFTRSNKGLTPTEKGLLFSEAARTIADTYRDFQVKADLAGRIELLEIIIGMPPFLSACCSANVLDQLTAALPDMRFSVFEGAWNLLQEELRAGNIHIAVTTGPLEWKEATVHAFGHGSMVVFLRKGSAAAAHVTVKDGKRWLDPVCLAGEPLAMTKPGQATRRIAESLMREAGVEPDVRQESRHIETLYRYAEKGIATAVAPLMANAEDRDRENQLICHIPPKYRGASICGCMVALPETGRLIPRPVYEILRENTIHSSAYLKQS